MDSLNLQAIPYVPVFQYDSRDTIAEVRQVLAVMPHGKVIQLNNLSKRNDGTLLSGVQATPFELPHDYYLTLDMKVLSQEEFDMKYLRIDLEEAIKAVGRPRTEHLLKSVRPAVREEVHPDGGHGPRRPRLDREFGG